MGIARNGSGGRLQLGGGPGVRLAGVSDQARSDWLTPVFCHICGQCLAYVRRRQRCALSSISEPSVLSVLDVHPAPLRGGWTSRAFHTLVQAVARRSQCRQLRHQTTSSRYRTTRPSPSWSAHRAEHQAIFSSTPILKMILNRFLTLRSQLRLTGRCSRNYSNACGESSSISESTSPDHGSVRGHELTWITSLVGHSQELCAEAF